MKFGGSCLENSRSFEQITKIIKNYLKKSKLIIVTSAMKGITDKLIDFYNKSCNEGAECDYLIEEIRNIHNKLINQIIDSNKKEYEKSINYLRRNIDELLQLGRVIQLIRPSLDIQDLIISYGERLSTFILTQYLNSIAIKSEFISSNELIITDDNFGNALPLLVDTEILANEKLVPLLIIESIQIVCITGFYGSTKKDKKITTFGRGGSDLTAAIIAYSLRTSFNCKVIYWKDVRGLLDADPNIVEKSSLLKLISYKEAKELAFFGSKILHPLSLDVNEKGNIP